MRSAPPDVGRFVFLRMDVSDSETPRGKLSNSAAWGYNETPVWRAEMKAQGGVFARNG
jgi:hypothetical protein